MKNNIESAQIKYEREVMKSQLRPLNLWRKDVEHSSAIATLFRMCEGMERRIRKLEGSK